MISSCFYGNLLSLDLTGHRSLTMIKGILVILQAGNIIVCVKLVLKYSKAHESII